MAGLIIGFLIDSFALIFAFVVFIFVRNYNLQMFQQNGYKNTEYLRWLRKNAVRQRMLIPEAVLSAVGLLLSFFYQSTAAEIVSFIVGLLAALYSIPVFISYSLYHSSQTRKKLVYTARVKRLIATDIILLLALYILVFCLMALPEAAGVRSLGALNGMFALMHTVTMLMILYLSLQPYVMIVINLINHPIEQSINNYYISDAKRKLKENPDLKIIGITGSYGKTSMKYYLKTLLSDFYNVLITPGNYNTTLGVVRTIREHLNGNHEIFLCEMGARHVNDIKEISDIVHPDAGIITSIGPQHLDTFFAQENVVNTKYELADALPEGALLFLNGDNGFVRGRAGRYLDSRKVVFYTNEWNQDIDPYVQTGIPGLDIPEQDKPLLEYQKDTEMALLNGYHVSDISVSNMGTTFKVTAPDGESETYTMRLIGFHNIINVLGAISVAHELGIPLDKLKVPVRRIVPVKHRLEMTEHGDVTIIDDAYNSNPVGSKAAVETLHMLDGLRILVTPGMVELGDKEEEYNYKFGTYAAANCDYIVLVGRRSHTDPIRKGALDSGFPEKRLASYDNLNDALTYAYSRQEGGHKYILLENDLPDAY